MTAAVANMALLGGNVDFISSGPSVISAIARGAPLKFVFICFNRPMHWLYAKPEIKDVKGLKGKKVGVSALGASTHFLVQEILKRYGLDSARDVTIRGVGTTANRYAVLQSGTMTNLTPPLTSKRSKPVRASSSPSSKRTTSSSRRAPSWLGKISFTPTRSCWRR